MSSPLTLVSMLERQLERRGDEKALFFLDEAGAESVVLTRAQLHRRSRAVAAALQRVAEPGDRVLLLYAHEPEFVIGLLACMQAQMIAVPCYPPNPMQLGRTLPRLLAIFEHAQAAVVLTTSAIASFAEPIIELAPALGRSKWVTSDTVAEEEEDGFRRTTPRSDDIAFLQYTSGSTGTPKGVIVRHHHLAAQRDVLSAMFGPKGEHDTAVSWLPLFHDMGLVGGLMTSFFFGTRNVLLAPHAHLRNPRLWLEAITRYRGNYSPSPNFGLELCLRKIAPADREGLELSSWRRVFTGAEPVRAETLRRFSEAFGPYGFKAAAMYPCYGLAEGTLSVIAGRPGAVERCDAAALEGGRATPAKDPKSVRELVGCGEAPPGHGLLIVDPETRQPLPPRQVGEIWIEGPTVAGGYWRAEELTQRQFEARTAAGDGPFLRTGDLGFLREDGQLYITGRLKDLIIVRGRNLYPHDLEATAERAAPGIRPGCSAAFTVEQHGGEEQLVVVVEVERRFHERRQGPPPPGMGERRKGDRRQAPADPTAEPLEPAPFQPEVVAGSVRRAVAGEHEVTPHAVVLLQAGTIPKTSSGKIQRRACREAFLKGTLEEIYKAVYAP